MQRRPSPPPSFVYLDYAGAHPILSEVLDIHASLSREYVANPHGTSRFSQRGRDAVGRAERDLAACLGIAEGEAQVVWTAGGTEADNLMALGILRRTRDGAAVLVDAGAHPALLEPCRRHAAREGGEVVEIPLDRQGRLALGAVAPAAASRACLVAVSQVNNETGAVHDLVTLRTWMRQHAPRALLAVDAMQAFGRIEVPWHAAAIDLLALAGCKFGGPAATGALLLRPGIVLEPLHYGGPQQRGLRAGSLDVVGIVEMTLAASISRAQRETEWRRLQALNQDLRAEFAGWRAPGIEVLSPAAAVPHILSVALPGYQGAVIMRLLAERNVLVATGSACRAESGAPSTVLRAMGIPETAARGALRISLGRGTTPDHIEIFLKELRSAVAAY
ncbi:MAG: aminotransferase class V-fold PLP-dependent enzyme [Lentisphaeria bacterium]|nr:aminotransferase class V-fold PLP-dependent enzyme [Lentisphaeria bacterium]